MFRQLRTDSMAFVTTLSEARVRTFFTAESVDADQPVVLLNSIKSSGKWRKNAVVISLDEIEALQRYLSKALEDDAEGRLWEQTVDGNERKIAIATATDFEDWREPHIRDIYCCACSDRLGDHEMVVLWGTNDNRFKGTTQSAFLHRWCADTLSDVVASAYEAEH